MVLGTADLTDLDDTDDDLVDDVEDEDDEAADDADDDSPETKAKPDKAEKRVRDLQSMLDKALAENNKLKKIPVQEATKPAVSRDPEVERWMLQAQDATRSRFYDADPRFKEYGIDPAVITGGTPEEMQLSQKAVLKIISRVETRARNKTLQEHGFSPPPKGGGSDRSRRDFATMDATEFDRLVKDAVG